MPDPNVSERMRELGKLSGKARRTKRERSFEGKLEALVGKRAAEKLLATSAGTVAAVRIVENAGGLERQAQPEPAATRYGAYDSREEWEAAREAVMARLLPELKESARRDGDGLAGDRRNPASSRVPMTTLGARDRAAQRAQGPPDATLPDPDDIRQVPTHVLEAGDQMRTGPAWKPPSRFTPAQIEMELERRFLESLPKLSPENRAVAIHRHNRQNLGLEPDDGNTEQTVKPVDSYGWSEVDLT